MTVRDMAIWTDAVPRAEAKADDAFVMDQDAFTAFYERTSRPLWAYLSRLTNDPGLADELLQEAYYRFLRVRIAWDSESHRRSYLFRIATNLTFDRRRRHCRETPLEEGNDRHEVPAEENGVERTDQRADVRRALARLKPRERALLWLAYGEGSSHKEIADTLGLRPGGIKVMLFRARRKMAALLGATEKGRAW